MDKGAGGLTVTTEPAAGGAAETMDADVVLVCVGRRVYIDNLGTEDLGIKMDGHKIAVDDCYATNVPSVFAIGDIIDGPMLAHKAEDEGAMAHSPIHCLTHSVPHSPKDEGALRALVVSAPALFLRPSCCLTPSSSRPFSAA